jgi:hypothetical protein
MKSFADKISNIESKMVKMVLLGQNGGTAILSFASQSVASVL